MLQIILLLSVAGGTAAAGGPDANPFPTSPIDASRILAPDFAAPALETFYGPLLPQDVAEQAAQGTPTTPAAPVEEEYYENIYHTFELDAGGALYGDFNTELQVSTDVIIGAILSLEDELGVSQSASVLRADMQYKFNRRNGLQLSYYDIRRDGERTIADDIIVGGVTIPAGSVETEFDTLILKFNYQYNFVAEPRVLIGASLGVFWINLETSVRSQTVNIEQSFEGNAPLPVLGLHGAYALGKNWSLNANAEVFQLEVGDFGGYISDISLTLENDLTEHVGWGIGLNSFRLGVEMDDGNLEADIDYDYQGILLYLRVYF